MLFTFNFQMFNDDIPGIDADVLEQFKDELPQEEPAEQEEQQEEAHADHHSDNKDVEPTEQQTEEEEEVPEGSNVPYNRFKGVNERMKAAEARQRELEAELAKYKISHSSKSSRHPLHLPFHRMLAILPLSRLNL